MQIQATQNIHSNVFLHAARQCQHDVTEIHTYGAEIHRMCSDDHFPFMLTGHYENNFECTALAEWSSMLTPCLGRFL